jgi:uncharacterized cupin superfamily protein
MSEHRTRSLDAFTHPLEHAAYAADEVVAIWEMTEGVAHDTEVEELFVVLSGTGSVAFEDGEVIDLHPGSVVRLRAGERTTWTITQTLRKVYIAG